MANEERLIDADALISKFKAHRELFVSSWDKFKKSPLHVKTRVDELDTCIAGVINSPTVDAVEVVHGRWVGVDYDIAYECSVCRYLTQYNLSNYCPNCGAKMDGGAERDIAESD